MKILGIETSCDESAISVIEDGRILSNVVHTQEVHRKWGGVIPELASRDHLRSIIPTLRSALEIAGISFDDLDCISACYGPGLLGSLLVGLCAGKALAWSLGKRFVAVHHLEGHIFSAQIEKEIEVPYLAMIVSGGHSHIYHIKKQGEYVLVGKTRDDASGEAFDKGAKALGLPYPGGPSIEKTAINGNPKKFRFPRAMRGKGELDMSFSGIKTSLINLLATIPQNEIPKLLPDLSASYQEAIVDTLVMKLREAINTTGVERITVVGGVSANKRFRYKLDALAKKFSIELIVPPIFLCTDNGAMIASAGAFHFERGEFSDWDISAVSRLSLDEIGKSIL